MPGAHAKLSPSSADRWISCPASIRMTEEHTTPGDDRGSAYAQEGTLAHSLAEIEAGHTFGLISRGQYLSKRKIWRAEFDAEQYPEGTFEEMSQHVRAYIAFLAQRLRRFPNSRILLEQKLDTGIPESWGTSDAVIYSPMHVEIVDLKYGQGVRVAAEKNSQLRCYGCGALDYYGDILGDTEIVIMTVFQPRMDNYDSEELTADELRAWRTDVAIPAALETKDPNARFGPSEKACRWCPVAAICRVRAETAVMEEFGPIDELGQDILPLPEVLTDDELGVILHKLPMLVDWAKAVEAYAKDRVYSKNEPIPGWKIVMSGGRRNFVDQEAALDALIEEGYGYSDIAEVKIKGIGVLEKLLGGKKKFDDKLGHFMEKGPGKPSLVPESDKRPAVNPELEAISEFEQEAIES